MRLIQPLYFQFFPALGNLVVCLYEILLNGMLSAVFYKYNTVIYP